MSIEYAVHSAAAPNPTFHDDEKAALVTDAERVLAAFLRAVQQRLGPEAARRAAGYWIEAFESAAFPSRQACSSWKSITIAAASRLARETGPARFAEGPA